MDEFSLIRHVYENAIDEIRELEAENAFYQPRMKSDLIRGLVLGNRDIAQTKELLEKNGWEIPFEGMFLACFFIENSDSSDLLAPIVQTRISQHLHETLNPVSYTHLENLSAAFFRFPCTFFRSLHFSFCYTN